MNRQDYQPDYSGSRQNVPDYSQGGAWYVSPPKTAEPRTRTRVRANTVNNGGELQSRPVSQPSPAGMSSARMGAQPSQGMPRAGGTAPDFRAGVSAAQPRQAAPAPRGGIGYQPNYGATPPPQRKPERPSSPMKKPPKKKNFLWPIIGILAAAIAIAVGLQAVRTNQAKKAVEPYQSVYLDNVYVDGICLGGMTREEGRAAVENRLTEKKNSWYITLRNEYGSRNITADMLGIAWDPNAALAQAWQVGHVSGVDAFAQQEEIQHVLNNPEGYHFSSAEQLADTAQIDSILDALAKGAYRAPQDAQFLGFDPDNQESPFSFQQEVWGQELDTEKVRAQILSLVENLESGEVELQTIPLQPSVTVNDLAANYELRGRCITPISDKSTEDRTGNIRLAFSRINGLQLKDGETFSFNDLVGRRTIENGFNAAVEYIYGQEEQGIGGGVCQASTTVYVAASEAGMKIVKRRAHSMAVSYTDLGLDATVNSTKGHEIDFSFKNKSGGTVYLTAHVISSPTNKKKLMCEVRIYGPSLNGKRYELISQVKETIPKPEEPTYKKDKEGEYVTYTDQQKMVIKGREGYVVESYLVTYENNVETGRTLMYTDTYPEKADTVYVGVTQRE